jgi:hypothetical protein
MSDGHALAQAVQERERRSDQQIAAERLLRTRVEEALKNEQTIRKALEARLQVAESRVRPIPSFTAEIEGGRDENGAARKWKLTPTALH